MSLPTTADAKKPLKDILAHCVGVPLFFGCLVLVGFGFKALVSPKRIDFKDSFEEVYRQPKVEAAIKSLISHTGSPLPEASKAAGLSLRGKALVIFCAQDEERSAGIHNRLPEAIRARHWSEVGTVVLVFNDGRTTGMWMRGGRAVSTDEVAVYRLSLLDLAEDRRTEVTMEAVSYHQRMFGSNAEPFEKVADFVAQLPRR